MAEAPSTIDKFLKTYYNDITIPERPWSPANQEKIYDFHVQKMKAGFELGIFEEKPNEYEYRIKSYPSFTMKQTMSGFIGRIVLDDGPVNKVIVGGPDENIGSVAPKALSHECPCGIVRADCDYHR